MKAKIQYSTFVNIMTLICICVPFIFCILTIRDKPLFFILLSLYVFLFVFALFYGAGYIKADNKYVMMGSILRKRKILMRDIASVELFQPTMGAKRIFGSGGFMGYWGIFKEGDIGRYYAFYGKSSDCFLVRMHNGDKYVLGCENPSAMVDYIKSHINS